MVSNMAGKIKTGAPKGTAVIGNNVAAVQAALILAQMGIEVKLVTESSSLGWDGIISSLDNTASQDKRFILPLLLQAVKHPLVTLYTNTRIESISGEKGNFKLSLYKQPRFISEELCTSCGSCQQECSARITSFIQGQKVQHTAIHAPLLEQKAVPSAYIIEKNGLAPCQIACPLGINIQGFISLLANGKTDKALALINKSAPLAGILGRVCTHPCEEKCNRGQIDNPVYIRALHRFAADNASEIISYGYQPSPELKDIKIAIVGSGPAGLTAAWDLTRRGYSPVVFESHGVVGGMLATGIPRFRLPKEIREREIAAITNMGVNIRTGITVGRDVTFTYLKERGYKAFFLAIGTQRDLKLNVPGEELDGVVDCMSLLLTLNLKVDYFAGTHIVVIGGGNAAVDCARAALRIGAKKVTMVYRRTREEMPAAPEEVADALDEGVNIEYQTIPVEILGNGSKVTGLRCQKTELRDAITPKGKHKPVPIPGTEFNIDADHVVVAIGQASNASQLEIEGLNIDKSTGLIKVNPLTLESSLPGVFAGGDCVMGPNNVVEAMANGLRAAESIDRYLQGTDLGCGRSLEPQKTAEVDFDSIEITPYKRAKMPVMKLQKRSHSLEETTTGLSAQTTSREAQRCLNCALCSRCMECEDVCKLGAVFHEDTGKSFDIGAQAILRFTDTKTTAKNSKVISQVPDDTGGVRTIEMVPDGKLADQLSHAMAIALETAVELKSRKPKKQQQQDLVEEESKTAQSEIPGKRSVSKKQIGVFLCNCGDNISSVINYENVAGKISSFAGVSSINQIKQACTESGARQIASIVKKQNLDSIVLAACRCCNVDQICFSCTDRRSLCLKYLDKHLISKSHTFVDFINVREHCAWKYKDDPPEATRNAIQMISAGISRTLLTTSPFLTEQPILEHVLIIGGSLANLSAANVLATRGHHVQVIAGLKKIRSIKDEEELIRQTIEQLHKKNVIIKSWPDKLRLSGSPGNYNANLQFDSKIEDIKVGALLVDISGIRKKELLQLTNTTNNGLLGRIVSNITDEGFFGSPDTNLLHGSTIKETAGIFLLSSEIPETAQAQVQRGLAAAARVAAFLEQTGIKPRDLVVEIDKKLCRGCGDCTAVCSFIEMKPSENGVLFAYIDKALCLGCGTCIASCPTGAINQPLQSDKQIVSTLCAILGSNQITDEEIK